ncbi:DMT family transporter [Neobacillus sp. PS3-34]|uniref:DMT family transporter n=1 Tax=Neobacillus sp. PS3-34 TaxID=3070678 RepID=UPI0027DF4684|nr:DMT family transporter [Neobacillus sp. PS3-34]WML50521.1 DMT family transporter [Neobacillus sp. PS3-34]
MIDCNWADHNACASARVRFCVRASFSYRAVYGRGRLGSGIAYLLYYFLVQKGSPEFASLVTYLVPVSAILWGALLLNESIHLTMIIGLIAIFAGVYISSLKMTSKPKKKAAA